MNLRHFRVFLTVCEAGTMTQAAEALYMTQPSVSQVIAELEREYKVRLFERLNHRLYLTAAGERLRSYASHILNLSEQARKELSGLAAGGTIRIGASLTIGAHLLPTLIRVYHTSKPDVEIFSRVDNTGVIEKWILEDQLDLGLVEGPIYSQYIKEDTFCDDELILVCGPGNALWEKNKISIHDLDGKAFIIREPGSGTRAIFEQTLQESGVNWILSGVYNNTEAIKRAVREDLGLAIIPRIAVGEEMQRGLVRAIDIEGLKFMRKFSIIYHRQKFLTESMLGFMRVCKEFSAISETNRSST